MGDLGVPIVGQRLRTCCAFLQTFRDMGVPMARQRLYLGYETAFWIWRKTGPLAFSSLVPSRVRSLKGGVPTADKVHRFRSEHPDLTLDCLDVLVGEGDQRNIKGVRNHVTCKPYPDRSFYQLEDDVYIASPELCLMQLASKLPEQQVTKLALEMCGFYAIDPYSDDPGMSKRPLLTSASKLKAYASRMFMPESRARAAHFLRYVADGSASPRETALFMLLCMSPRFGGYGLAIPELNKRINLTPSEQLMVGAQHFDCDLYWQAPREGTAHNVAVEYDSSRHHTAAEKQERDAVRRNMLQYKNIQVITATRKQVNNASEFDKLARQIGRAIGKRFRIPEKEHIKARAELRKTLFDWDIIPSWEPDADWEPDTGWEPDADREPDADWEPDTDWEPGTGWEPDAGDER